MPTDTQEATLDVLIVGAGPTGLTLACDLLRRGVRARIVDASREYFRGSRGKGLQPRTLEVFDDLGIIDEVLAAGGEYPKLRIHAGWLTFPWDLQKRAKKTPDVPYPNIWMVPQAKTEEILRRRLEALGGRVELGTALIAFDQTDEHVTATLSRDGDYETLHARYLVGADGGKSFVRKTLGVRFDGEQVDAGAGVVGDLLVDGLDRRAWHVWPRGRWGPVSLCALPHTETFQLYAKVDPSLEGELTAESVGDLVTRALGRAPFTIRAATWLSLYRPSARLAEHYRAGRVFLAGDAAHVHPPTGGQGLNAGVQDAYNLGWKLGAVLAGAPDSLLDTYEEERREVAAAILGFSTALYRSRWKRRGDEARQLGTSYRTSSIACDLRGSRTLHAGDRAADARTHHEGRLFDLLRGPHATVLAFGSSAERAASDACRSRDIKIVRVDTSVELQRTYGATDDSLALVRPDGYLGFVGTSATGGALSDYLDRIAPAA